VFNRLLARRLKGEPVAYLVGEKEFFGRPFFVDDRVLIPRPETEHLVEAALGLDLPKEVRLLDLGTGSGCLAISLVLEIPRAWALAVDLSPAALAVTAKNVSRHGATDRVALACVDLVAGVDFTGFDLVISNPPYVAWEERDVLSPEILDFEPEMALFAGQDGQSLIRRLLHDLQPLASGSYLLLEIGAGQDEALRRLAAASSFQCLEILPDYGGIPRVAVLRQR
jgi:release factor glutamine methyltransferase